MDYNDVSFILKSEKRKKIMLLLEQPRNPTFLSKQLKTSLSNISMKLKDMSNAKLVECVNPDDTKGRIYKLTAKGNNIVEEIKKMES